MFSAVNSRGVQERRKRSYLLCDVNTHSIRAADVAEIMQEYTTGFRAVTTSKETNDSVAPIAALRFTCAAGVLGEIAHSSVRIFMTQ